MHARPAARRAQLALLLLACAVLLLIYALLITHAILRACVYLPYYAPLHSPASWGPPVLGETLVTWRTSCNIRLKQMKHLEHMCSHCNVCKIQIKLQIKYLQHMSKNN
jgi:hypothetical protein